MKPPGCEERLQPVWNSWLGAQKALWGCYSFSPLAPQHCLLTVLFQGTSAQNRFRIKYTADREHT